MSYREHFIPSKKYSSMDVLAIFIVSILVLAIVMTTVVILTHPLFGYNKAIALGFFISALALVFMFEKNSKHKI